MSRTKRIYNRLRWKRCAERFLAAKYASGYWIFGYSTDGTIWAGNYCYHPYKELHVRCNCPRCFGEMKRENRRDRRKLRLEEKHLMEHWVEED